MRPTVLLPAAMKPVRATSGGNDVRLAGLACAHIEVERATGDYEAGSGKFAVEWKRAARKILTSRRDRKTGSAGTIPGIHEPQSPYQPSTPDVVVTCDPRGMIAKPLSTNLRVMQLIQIGETKQKTVLELVQEMAARQLAEIEQLKTAAAQPLQKPAFRAASGWAATLPG